MIETYAAILAISAFSLTVGQATVALCGRRQWSWLSPALGLALLTALCWGTVRLPGHGAVSAALVLVVALVATAFLWRAGGGFGEALRTGAPVALLALAAGSLPFFVEGHFGILGTSFNPDMSQHLLAGDRLASGAESQLLNQGYPLGPHAIVVALNQGLGIGLVQGFDGLTLAVGVLASLTALSAFADRPLAQRIPVALLVGLPYMVASYFAQGAFKETMQALFVLAFVLALRESTTPAWRKLSLRFVPAALLAVGSVYTYSFPGLIWLGVAFAIWAVMEVLRPGARPAGGAVGGPAPEEALATAGGGGSPTVTGPAGGSLGPAVVRSVLLALLVFAVLLAPEFGRITDFHSFETFDPSGPGLGNLFGQISPFEALGIWPSGDFRLSPGDGAVPPFGYFFGAAFASVMLVYGLLLCWRRRETAVIAGFLTAALAYAAVRLGGTPYTAAKAVEIAAPLAALAILLPLSRRPVGVLYLLAAAGCSLLALANAPVGPASYSPALTDLRTLTGQGPTTVLAPHRLLAQEHGEPYLVWELRGGRVCIQDADRVTGGEPPTGIRFVIAGATDETASAQPPFMDLKLRRRAGPYLLWERRGPVRGASDCPLIAVRQARQGPHR